MIFFLFVSQKYKKKKKLFAAFVCVFPKFARKTRLVRHVESLKACILNSKFYFISVTLRSF